MATVFNQAIPSWPYRTMLQMIKTEKSVNIKTFKNLLPVWSDKKKWKRARFSRQLGGQSPCYLCLLRFFNVLQPWLGVCFWTCWFVRRRWDWSATRTLTDRAQRYQNRTVFLPARPYTAFFPFYITHQSAWGTQLFIKPNSVTFTQLTYLSLWIGL